MSKITEKTVTIDGPVVLSDGSSLIHKQRVTNVSRIIKTTMGDFDAGHVILGPLQQWVRMPDGTHVKKSHFAHLASLASLAKDREKPSIASRIIGFFRGMW